MIERALGLLLLNALWQPLVIAAATYAVLRIARSASASTRCAVLTSGLIIAVLLPIVCAAALTYTHASAPSVNAAHHRVYTREPSRTVPAPKAPLVTSVATGTQTQNLLRFERPQIAVPPRVVFWIILAWALVALMLLLRLFVSLSHLARLRRDALPLAPAGRAQLERWQQKTAGTNLRLCVSDDTPVPIAIGLFDAMVLIPRHLVEELDASDLDRIVLHEIAHLRRRDGIVYAVQQIAGALFFFSPGILWIARTLDIEREVACDDWVLERGSDAAPYATCLVRLAERTPWPHEALPAPGAFITRHSMSIRVERILHGKRDGRLRAAPATLAAALISSIAIGIAAFSFAPSLADPQPAPLRHTAQRAAHHTTPLAVAAVATASPKAALPHRTVAHVLPKPRARAAIVARETPVPDASGGDYISQMQALFGSKLKVEELVELKNMDVTPAFIQAIRAAGYPNVTPQQIVTVRAVGLTPESIAQLRSAFGPLSLRGLTTLASLHVDAAYRDRMTAAGLHDLTPERLVELKGLEITPDYIAKANALGFGTLSVEQLVELKSLDIDAVYLQKVRAHGFDHPTLRQVLQLKASGVIP